MQQRLQSKGNISKPMVNTEEILLIKTTCENKMFLGKIYKKKRHLCNIRQYLHKLCILSKHRLRLN